MVVASRGLLGLVSLSCAAVGRGVNDRERASWGEGAIEGGEDLVVLAGVVKRGVDDDQLCLCLGERWV